MDIITTITAYKAAIALILSIAIIGYAIWKDSRKKYRIRHDWHTDLYSVVYEDEFGERKAHSSYLSKERARQLRDILNRQC